MLQYLLCGPKISFLAKNRERLVSTEGPWDSLAVRSQQPDFDACKLQKYKYSGLYLKSKPSYREMRGRDRKITQKQPGVCRAIEAKDILP